MRSVVIKKIKNDYYKGKKKKNRGILPGKHRAGRTTEQPEESDRSFL